MMKICSISSSSSGNCIYVGTKETHILIDAGISGKRLKSGLDKIGLTPEDINGILITHEHSDHIKGLGVVSRKYNIPIYATALTWKKVLSSSLTGIIEKNLFREIMPDRDFNIKELVIHPFNTSHDAVQPVCYTITKDKKKISVVTDLGTYNNYIKENLKDSNVLFIEANHDIKMLKDGSYPYYLKQRILSDTGHLSNEMSGKLISELCHENLQYVVLGHLSKENNHPEIANQTVRTILGLSVQSSELSAGSICISDIQFIVSEREEITGPITI